MMNHIKFLTAICLIFTTLKVGAVETAEQVLGKCAEKIAQAPSIKIDFTLNTGDSGAPCALIISKDKYRLSSPNMEVWYDGQTQWAYATDTKEVALTEPTEEELLESNPFAVLNNYKQSYNIRRLSGKQNDIELVAKSKMSNIRKAVVTISDKTWLPTKLIVTMSNGRTFAATVTSINEKQSVPASTFVYNAERYPAKIVNDLR